MRLSFRITHLRHLATALVFIQFLTAPAFAAPDSPPSVSAGVRTVTFRVLVPEGTGTVYLSGNRPELGPWVPGKFALTGSGRERTAVLEVPTGTYLEFKFTGGSWATVETTAAGLDIPNRTYTVPAAGDAVYTGTVAGWHPPLSDVKKSTATASVSMLSTNFVMPQLGRTRRIWLYLPPDYATTSNTYPVLYMQDGQNVFDATTSFAGEWGVDETLDRLHREGDPGCIVVAVENSAHRTDEYNPWKNPEHPERGGGEGDQYVDFLVHTLKPYVDQHYRTRPDRRHTGVAGSSAGGLISLYAALTHPEVFGRAGIFSCASWIVPEEISACIRSAKLPADTRFYFVAGEFEGPAGIYAKHQRELVALLGAAGLSTTSQIRSVASPDGQHAEWFWRREFPAAYQWLFADK